jgi:hypothetical protein
VFLLDECGKGLGTWRSHGKGFETAVWEVYELGDWRLTIWRRRFHAWQSSLLFAFMFVSLPQPRSEPSLRLTMTRSSTSSSRGRA